MVGNNYVFITHVIRKWELVLRTSRRPPRVLLALQPLVGAVVVGAVVVGAIVVGAVVACLAVYF